MMLVAVYVAVIRRFPVVVKLAWRVPQQPPDDPPHVVCVANQAFQYSRQNVHFTILKHKGW